MRFRILKRPLLWWAGAGQWTPDERKAIAFSSVLNAEHDVTPHDANYVIVREQGNAWLSVRSGPTADVTIADVNAIKALIGTAADNVKTIDQRLHIGRLMDRLDTLWTYYEKG